MQLTNESSVDHTSIAYLEVVIQNAQRILIDEVNKHKALEHHQKADGSPVTSLDILVQRHFEDQFTNTSVALLGEEETTIVPVASPELTYYLDPLDGTALFKEAYDKSITNEKARIVCPVAIGLGGIYRGEAQPTIGAVVFPFLKDGSRLYIADETSSQRSIEKSMPSQYLSFPDINPARRPAILFSKRGMAKYGEVFCKAGFDTVECGGIAAALAMVDPELLEQYGLGAHAQNFVGHIMMGGHDWDVAAPTAIIRALGGTVTGLTGKSRSFGKGENGAVFARSPEWHQTIMKIFQSI